MIGVDSAASVVGHLTHRLPPDATPDQVALRLRDRARVLEDLAARADDTELAQRASAWAVAARWSAADLVSEAAW